MQIQQRASIRYHRLQHHVGSLSAGALFAVLAACAPDAVRLGTSTTPAAVDASRAGDATCHPHPAGAASANDETSCTPPCGTHAHCIAPGTCHCDTYFVFDGQGCVCAPNTVASLVDGETVCAPDYPAWGIGPLAPTGFVDHCDGTVTHELTGLTWQVDGTVAGGLAWEDARDYCNALELGGYGDWRLPTAGELVSSLDLTGSPWPGAGSPFVWDPDRFKWIWSSAQYQDGGLHFWAILDPRWLDTSYVHFGHTGGGQNHAAETVRCVRGTATRRSQAVVRFETSDMTVSDTATGLVWQRHKVKDFSTFTWEEADAYCSDNEAGLPGAGWRLPDIRELVSLIDRTRREPAIDTATFPGITWIHAPLEDGRIFWSSTPQQFGGVLTDCRYAVEFRDGLVYRWSVYDMYSSKTTDFDPARPCSGREVMAFGQALCVRPAALK
jgi:hypothetical protein